MSYLVYNGKRVISSNKYVTGPGEYQIGQMVVYSISSGNWAVGFINELGPAAANFTVSNARMYVHQGDGNSF